MLERILLFLFAFFLGIAFSSKAERTQYQEKVYRITCDGENYSYHTQKQLFENEIGLRCLNGVEAIRVKRVGDVPEVKNKNAKEILPPFESLEFRKEKLESLISNFQNP